jgi:lactate dehydrogenase-like 2-hydroxyacid dehydrogenase
MRSQARPIAIIGTGRIGLAMIKKCSGFDMNILCYDPAYQNHEFIKAIQELMDLRHARGIQKEKTWIKYVEFEDALRGADYVSLHVPLLRRGRGGQADVSPHQRKYAQADEIDRLLGK